MPVRMSVSTWSLHHLMGRPVYEPNGSGFVNTGPGGPGMPLLEVPAACAAHGIRTLEICHFHFPRTDDAYLAELRSAAERAGVELYSVLIDDGDITAADPEEREADLAMIRGWIDIAGRLGAACVRVVAGQAEPSGDAVRRSAAALAELAAFGRARNVGVITENFGRLTKRADAVVRILDAAGPEIGLCADFGNFAGPPKYTDLAAILPRATSIHAKAVTGVDGTPDWAEFRGCLGLAKSAGFDGPVSLIHEAPGDPWPGLSRLKAEVESVLPV